MIETVEYEARLARVRAAMKDEHLDAVVAFSRTRGHVRYLSGYFPGFLTNWAYLIVPLQGDPRLCVRFDFDVPRARDMVWFPDVRPARELGEVRRDARRVGVAARDLGVDEGGREIWETVARAYTGAEIVDASDLLLDLRRHKTEAEFALLLKAGRIAAASAESMRRAARPGVTDRNIVAAAEARARRMGAERTLVLVAVDADDAVTEPRGAVVRPGQAVQTEITLCVEGYWVQVNRTFGAAAGLRKICLDALEAGRHAARPGQPARAMVEAARAVLDREAPREALREYDFGHGVGTDCPESPRLLPEGTEGEIQEDMAVVLHTGLRIPGRAGAFVGGPLRPRADGGEWLR